MSLERILVALLTLTVIVPFPVSMSSNVDDQEKDSTQDSPYGMFVEMNPLVFVTVSTDDVTVPPPPPPPPPKPVRRAISVPSALSTSSPSST